MLTAVPGPFVHLNAEITAVRSAIGPQELREEFAALGKDFEQGLHEVKISLIRWKIGIAIVQVAVQMGICHFLVSHLGR